jgi:hypothetical protein
MATSDVHIYTVLSSASAGQDAFFVGKFNTALNSFETYFREFMISETDENVSSPAWHRHAVFADEFLTPAGLSAVPAGSILLLSTWSFDVLDSVPTDAGYLESRLRSSPRLWSILSARQPLIVALTEDASCTLDWPRSTHHILYRATWCEGWHREWRESLTFEDEQRGGKRPWVRAFPFGASYDGGNVSLQLARGRPPSADRRLLFSFRGTVTSNKPSRAQLMRELSSQRARLEAVAANALPHARPYPFGRFLLDAYVTPEDSTSRGILTYAELLQESVFTLSPPGDLWETYRTWEAIAAGSVPVLMHTERSFGCRRPSLHMHAQSEGWALWVSQWSEVPAALEREAANVSAMLARQEAMYKWVEHQRKDVTRRLVRTTIAMRAGLWRPATRCKARQLNAHMLHAQQLRLASYWRKPQPKAPSLARGEASSIFGSQVPRSFHGGRGLCSHAQNWHEACKSAGCAPPLLASFSCA